MSLNDNSVYWELNNELSLLHHTSHAFRYLNNNNVIPPSNSITINDTNDIIYTDLNDIYRFHNSFTISFTLNDLDFTSTSNVNYLTLGYQSRNFEYKCVTIGKSNCKPTIGFIERDKTIKASPEPDYHISSGNTTYTLIHTSSLNNEYKFKLYQNSNLVCTASNVHQSNLELFNILDAKMFLGTSAWTCEDGYQTIDCATNISFVDNIQFHARKTIYPPNSMINNFVNNGYKISNHDTQLYRVPNIATSNDEFLFAFTIDNHEEIATNINPIVTLETPGYYLESITDTEPYTFKVCKDHTYIHTTDINSIVYNVNINGTILSSLNFTNTLLLDDSYQQQIFVDNNNPIFTYKPMIIENNRIGFKILDITDDYNNFFYKTEDNMYTAFGYHIYINASNENHVKEIFITDPRVNHSDLYFIDELLSEEYYHINGTIYDPTNHVTSNVVPLHSDSLVSHYSSKLFRTADVTDPNTFNISIAHSVSATYDYSLIVNVTDIQDSYTDGNNILQVYSLLVKDTTTTTSDGNVINPQFIVDSGSNVASFDDDQVHQTSFQIKKLHIDDSLLEIEQLYELYIAVIDSHNNAKIINRSYIIPQTTQFTNAFANFSPDHKTISTLQNNLIIQWNTLYPDSVDSFYVHIFHSNIDPSFIQNDDDSYRTWYVDIPLSTFDIVSDSIISYSLHYRDNQIFDDSISSPLYLYLDPLTINTHLINRTVYTNSIQFDNIYESLSHNPLISDSSYPLSFQLTLNSNIHLVDSYTFNGNQHDIDMVVFSNLYEGVTYNSYVTTTNILNISSQTTFIDEFDIPSDTPFINYHFETSSPFDDALAISLKTGELSASNHDPTSSFHIYFTVLDTLLDDDALYHFFQDHPDTLRTSDIIANTTVMIPEAFIHNNDNLFKDTSEMYYNTIDKYYHNTNDEWILTNLIPSYESSNIYISGMIIDTSYNKMITSYQITFDFSIHDLSFRNISYDALNYVTTSNVIELSWNVRYPASNQDFNIQLYGYDLNHHIEKTHEQQQLNKCTWVTYLSNVDLSDFHGSNLSSGLQFDHLGKSILNEIIVDDLIIDTRYPDILVDYTFTDYDHFINVNISTIHEDINTKPIYVTLYNENINTSSVNSSNLLLIQPPFNQLEYTITNLDVGSIYSIYYTVSDDIGNTSSDIYLQDNFNIRTFDDDFVQIQTSTLNDVVITTDHFNLSNTTFHDKTSTFDVYASIFEKHITDFNQMYDIMKNNQQISSSMYNSNNIPKDSTHSIDSHTFRKYYNVSSAQFEFFNEYVQYNLQLMGVDAVNNMSHKTITFNIQPLTDASTNLDDYTTSAGLHLHLVYDHGAITTNVAGNNIANPISNSIETTTGGHVNKNALSTTVNTAISYTDNNIINTTQHNLSFATWFKFNHSLNDVQLFYIDNMHKLDLQQYNIIITWGDIKVFTTNKFTLAPDVWYHIAVNVLSNDLEIFLDGVLLPVFKTLSIPTTILSTTTLGDDVTVHSSLDEFTHITSYISLFNGDKIYSSSSDVQMINGVKTWSSQDSHIIIHKFNQDTIILSIRFNSQYPIDSIHLYNYDNDADNFTLIDTFETSYDSESELVYISLNNLFITNTFKIELESPSTPIIFSKFIINGHVAKRYVSPSFNTINTNSLQISKNLEGALDDTRLYNRQLYHTDVQNLNSIGGRVMHFDFENDIVGQITEKIRDADAHVVYSDIALIETTHDSVVGTNSFTFSGSNYIEINNDNGSVSLDPNQLTVATWVKLDQDTSFSPIVSIPNDIVFGIQMNQISIELFNVQPYSALFDIIVSNETPTSFDITVSNLTISHHSYNDHSYDVTVQIATSASFDTIEHDIIVSFFDLKSNTHSILQPSEILLDNTIYYVRGYIVNTTLNMNSYTLTVQTTTLSDGPIFSDPEVTFFHGNDQIIIPRYTEYVDTYCVHISFTIGDSLNGIHMVFVNMFVNEHTVISVFNSIMMYAMTGADSMVVVNKIIFLPNGTYDVTVKRYYDIGTGTYKINHYLNGQLRTSWPDNNVLGNTNHTHFVLRMKQDEAYTTLPPGVKLKRLMYFANDIPTDMDIQHIAQLNFDNLSVQPIFHHNFEKISYLPQMATLNYSYFNIDNVDEYGYVYPEINGNTQYDAIYIKGS